MGAFYWKVPGPDIVNPGWVEQGLDRLGNFASKGTLRSYMARPPQKAGQADFSVPAIVVCPWVDLLVLDCPRPPFNEDVVVALLSAGPADLDPLPLESGHNGSSGELTSLIGVEDLWFATTFQCDLQGIKTKILCPGCP